VKKSELGFPKTMWLILSASASILTTEAATNVVVWDTGSRFADTPGAENRARGFDQFVNRE